MALRQSVVVACLLMASAPALAQTDGQQGRGAMRAACKADVSSLCSGVQPGGGRIKQCLQSNWDKVSQGCKDAIGAAKAAHNAGASGGTASPPQQ